MREVRSACLKGNGDNFLSEVTPPDRPGPDEEIYPDLTNVSEVTSPDQHLSSEEVSPDQYPNHSLKVEGNDGKIRDNGRNAIVKTGRYSFKFRRIKIREGAVQCGPQGPSSGGVTQGVSIKREGIVRLEKVIDIGRVAVSTSSGGKSEFTGICDTTEFTSSGGKTGFTSSGGKNKLNIVREILDTAVDQVEPEIENERVMIENSVADELIENTSNMKRKRSENDSEKGETEIIEKKVARRNVSPGIDKIRKLFEAENSNEKEQNVKRKIDCEKDIKREIVRNQIKTYEFENEKSMGLQENAMVRKKYYMKAGKSVQNEKDNANNSQTSPPKVHKYTDKNEMRVRTIEKVKRPNLKASATSVTKTETKKIKERRSVKGRIKILSDINLYPDIRDFLKKTTNKNDKILRANSPLEKGQIVENVSECFPANNGGVKLSPSNSQRT